MKRSNLFTIYLIVVLLFEATCFVCLKQRSAERRNLYSLNIKDVDRSIDFETNAIKSNKRNPLYKLNLSCLFSKKDSINTDYFYSLFKGGQIDSLKNVCIKELIEDIYLMYPQEPVFALNYSLVSMIEGDIQLALNKLETYANETFSTCEIILVAGLLNELNGNRSDALNHYSNAIAHFTDITESRFFEDLLKRDRDLAEQSISSALNRMEIEYNKDSDPIVAAKLGKLYYTIGEIERAGFFLLYALKELPTLNRTWYYLGCIKEEEGDVITAIEYYKRSYRLEETDLLVTKKLVEMNVLENSKLEYLKKHSVSNQSYRLEKIYGGRTISYPYILGDLERYCSHVIDD